MKKDPEIQRDVEDELNWEPSLAAAPISVKVKNGYVTLDGTVNSYMKKLSAERAAMRVYGVRSVTNNMDVKLLDSFKRSDAELKEAVINTIKWNSAIDEDRVKVLVKDGWVTLEGTVEWDFQKSKAKNLAEDLTGVIGVTNNITVVTSTPTSREIKDKIRAAIKRNIDFNGNKITVEVDGSKVSLSGDVRSLREKNDAEYAAWSAPGVTSVDNKLEVNYEEVAVV